MQQNLAKAAGKMVKDRLAQEIRDFIDIELSSSRPPNYTELIKTVIQRYGLQVSKSTISKRVKALKLTFRRGRKRTVSVGRRPVHSILLDCAGSFFLKGAELETGLLKAISQVLKPGIESAQAQKVLKLTQQINALLLYAPLFKLKTAPEIAGYKRRGLCYLTEQTAIPEAEKIAQYLHYLADQRLLPLITKEVAKACTEVLFMRIDFSKQTFYLDAQGRTVWPTPKIPRFFSATLTKTRSCIKDIFQFPSPQRPLILQTSPGYTFLPPEMFNFIQCFNQAQKEPIFRIAVTGKSGEVSALWKNLKPKGKCYFIAPLSPWQYARLQGTQIVRDFQRYQIGPTKETMAVADADINLFNPQLSKNIRVRAALVRRKEERLALITNISRHEERYIRKIAEQYFSRWPDEKVKTYYDLLEEGHEEILGRSQSTSLLTPLVTIGYRQKPEDVFRRFLEYLHRYTLSHFFPTQYEAEDIESMGEKFYKQEGFLKIKQNCWEVILRPFSQKDLQKDVQIACQRFNQSGIRLPAQKNLRISLLPQQ